jgi:hypothetical protein
MVYEQLRRAFHHIAGQRFFLFYIPINPLFPDLSFTIVVERGEHSTQCNQVWKDIVFSVHLDLSYARKVHLYIWFHSVSCWLALSISQ